MLLLLPLNSRSSAVLMVFCGFFDCIIEKRSNAEIYLLLLDHRRKNAVNGTDILVVVLVVMLVLVVVVMLLMPLAMVLVIFCFQKKL